MREPLRIAISNCYGDTLDKTELTPQAREALYALLRCAGFSEMVGPEADAETEARRFLATVTALARHT